MEKITAYFFDQPQFAVQSLRFKKFLYALVMLKLLYWAIYYPLYFGVDPIAYIAERPAAERWQPFYLLYFSDSSWPGAIFLGACALSVIAGIIFSRYSMIYDLLLWFCMINIHHKVYPTLTGGDFLLNQFLLIQIFLPVSFARGSKIREFQYLLHNLAGVSLVMQICYVYVFSALAKIGDPSWLQGSAIVQISQIRQFSLYDHHLAGGMWSQLSWIMTYLVLLYQLTFPFFIFIRKLKKPFLMAGVLMHLYISLVMGLLLFGLTMIAAYVFLWPAPRENASK